MLENILQTKDLIFYILAAETLFLLLLQLRTNHLLKRMSKIRTSKSKNLKQLKEEVKNGKSDIPVVKFEQPKTAKDEKKPDKKGTYDAQELAVLQEMMEVFFG